MANRNISTEVWNDSKFTDDFTAEDKYFWLFLLTTRYGNLSGCFEITPNQIAQDMGYSKETALNLIYRFRNIHHVISFDETTNEVLIHNWYKYNWTKSSSLEKPIYKFIDKIKSEDLRNIIIEMYESFKNGDRVLTGWQHLTNTNTIPNTKSIPITTSLSSKDLDKDKDLKDSIEYIVDYLNLKANTKYRYTTNKTKDVIKARLHEGFKLEDFQHVIDVKVDEWLNDDKFSKFLRPETLFSNKFESYLNQQQSMKKKISKFYEDDFKKTGELWK